VVEAADGRAAWQGLDGVDAVVLDWMLPDTDGIAWLRRLREASARRRRC
jgi:DNA-binding response OmpR family regulator